MNQFLVKALEIMFPVLTNELWSWGSRLFRAQKYCEGSLGCDIFVTIIIGLDQGNVAIYYVSLFYFFLTFLVLIVYVSELACTVFEQGLVDHQ